MAVTDPKLFLPTSLEEVRAMGWDGLDVIIVTGDGYVDHPSFGAAMVGRALQSVGLKVGILAQPEMRDPRAFEALGRPKLFFGVTAGNLDSMLANRTSRGVRRRDDRYTPGGRAGARPDRATIVYTQRIREAWPRSTVVIGGIEASLRRLAHYDFVSDRVRGSILLDSGAEILVYGMGELAILEIARRLAGGEPIQSIRDVPGTAVRLSADQMSAFESCPSVEPGDGFAVVLESFEDVARDRHAFSAMTRTVHLETNPFIARDIVQRHGKVGVLVNAPAPPLTTRFLDELHDLPFTRSQHPSYGKPIAALDTVKNSITIMRGCFGGCAFCALSLHQGRVVQSRSVESVLREISSLPDFHGTVTDIGGPTANLYRAGCLDAEKQRTCRRTSCLHPRRCRHLGTDPRPLIDLMRAVRKAPGVKHAYVASGVRMDVALEAPGYIEELAAHHVGGQLSVAPEHVSDVVLAAMRKPSIGVTERFIRKFRQASSDAGLEQFVVPYLMGGHPGCSVEEMIEAALWLKEHRFRPRQVQQFVPTPMTVATSMYHTRLDPISGKPVYVARGDRDKRIHKALLMYWHSGNRGLVGEACESCGRDPRLLFRP